LCLLPLSLLAGPEPVHSLVKIPLGWLDDLPPWAKIILPLIVTAILWWLASWLFCWLKIMPAPVAVAQRLEQSLIIGLDSCLLWRFPLGGLLLLHLLGSYIYFGKHPFWTYVNATAQKLLQPLHQLPLRLGRMDFAPLVGIIILFSFANFAENGMKTLHIRPLRKTAAVRTWYSRTFQLIPWPTRASGSGLPLCQWELAERAGERWCLVLQPWKVS